MEEKKVLSTDGVHTLAGRVFMPEGKPRGLFHVVHGMTEHIGRYEEVMKIFASYGFICFGYDHLGHGDTVFSPEERGFIAHEDGWKYLVADVKKFSDEMKAEYPDLPYMLLGHSMGSFIVRLAAPECRPSKLIVMGTGGPNPASGVGLAILNTISALKGEKYVSPFADKLMFGSYNKRFGYDDEYNWLTRDEAVRAAHAKDEKCQFKFSVSALIDLIKLLDNSNKRDCFASLAKNTHVLLVSGADDPVGDYGKGVKKVLDMYRKEEVNVRLKLYDDYRHEILNDTSREKVIEDIMWFVDRQ